MVSDRVSPTEEELVMGLSGGSVFGECSRTEWAACT